MKTNKRIFFVSIAIVVLAFFINPLINTATALFSIGHTAYVLIRFANEIVLKTPAGNYYMGLNSKHFEEFNQIYDKYPEHEKELLHAINLFIPGLEAMLDEKGNTIKITQNQVNAVKMEINWFASVASPALREDIEKELVRFPLDNFAGMTMDEAWEYVNSNWTPDSAISTTPTQETNQSAVDQASPSIAFGVDLPPCSDLLTENCLIEPMLVSESGKLVYFVNFGVYFEYPKEWQLATRSQTRNELILLPPSDSPEANSFGLIHLMFLPELVVEDWEKTLAKDTSCFGRTDIRWHRNVQIENFEGFECFWKVPNESFPYWEFFLYSEDDQTGFGILTIPLNDEAAKMLNNPESAQSIFPSILHIVESARIQEK